MRWFVEKFIPSFGICKDKRITEKQANVFIKNMKLESKLKDEDVYGTKTFGYEIKLRKVYKYNTGWFDKFGFKYDGEKQIYLLTIKHSIV